MSRKIIIIGIIAAALLGAAAVGMRVTKTPETVESSSALAETASAPTFTQPASPISTEAFVSESEANRVWNEALRTTEEPNNQRTEQPVAGVVNHHTLADDLIARFFAQLKTSRPDVERFVIISPDHFRAGRGYVSTHVRSYETGVGEVTIDKDAVRSLTDSGLAVEESGTLFEREHGLGALIPFLARAYPDASVVPVAIRGDIPEGAIPDLTAAIKNLWDDRTVIILSADMSHYLTAPEALKNDPQTLEWLKDRNMDIAGASDDYTDSGKAASALFAAMADAYPEARFTVFDHGISSEYGGDPDFTTSYITGVWVY